MIFYLLHQTQLNVRMHLDVYNRIWFQHGVVTDTTEPYILKLVSVNWLSFTVTRARENHNFCSNVSQSFKSVWSTFGILFRSIGVMNLMLIWSIFKLNNPKLRNLSHYPPPPPPRPPKSSRLDSYSMISLWVDVMIETTELYILIAVLMIFTLIHGQSYDNQKLLCSFCSKFWVDFDDMYPGVIISSVRSQLNLFHMIIIQGITLYSNDSTKCTL